MKKIYSTLLCVFILNACLAQIQTKFNYNYPNEYYYRCLNLHIKDSSYFLAGGIKFENVDCNQWSQGLHLSKIDSLGILQEQTLFSKCSTQIFIDNDNFHLTTNGFVFAGQKFSEVNTGNKLFLLEIDEFGDTLNLKYFFQDTLAKRAWSMCKTDDNGFSIVGSIDSTRSEYFTPEIVTGQILLIRLDSLGNQQWLKSYVITNDIGLGTWQSGRKIIQTWDKGFIISGLTYNFTNNDFLSFIMKVDSLGNYKWKQLFSAAPNDAPPIADIIETKDSCYVICGAKNYGEVFGGLYPFDGWLYKFDTNGAFKWQKTYREYYPNSGDWRDTIYCYFFSMAELDDGRIAVAGQVRKDEIGAAATTPFMYLLTPQGDTIFSKYFCLYPPDHPDWVNESFPNKIINTEDGGFAIGGWSVYKEWNEETQHWEQPERIFLIKTDSLGNDGVVISQTGNTTVIDDFKLKIYPNPAKNEFNFELPKDIKNDVLEIYSTNGAVIYQQKVQTGTNKINIESLPAGMYLVRIRGANLYGKFVKE